MNHVDLLDDLNESDVRDRDVSRTNASRISGPRHLGKPRRERWHGRLVPRDDAGGVRQARTHNSEAMHLEQSSSHRWPPILAHSGGERVGA